MSRLLVRLRSLRLLLFCRRRWLLRDGNRAGGPFLESVREGMGVHLLRSLG